jgi:hypothetical protein
MADMKALRDAADALKAYESGTGRSSGPLPN